MSLSSLDEAYKRFIGSAMTQDSTTTGASMSATLGFMGGLNTATPSCFICGKEATVAFAINRAIVYLCNDHEEISPDILKTLVGDNVTT